MDFNFIKGDHYRINGKGFLKNNRPSNDVVYVGKLNTDCFELYCFITYFYFKNKYFPTGYYKEYYENYLNPNKFWTYDLIRITPGQLKNGYYVIENK